MAVAISFRSLASATLSLNMAVPFNGYVLVVIKDFTHLNVMLFV